MVLKSSRSTRSPYLLRSTLGGAGLLGFEVVKSVNGPWAPAAVVAAHVGGVLVPFDGIVEFDGMRARLLLLPGVFADSTESGVDEGIDMGLLFVPFRSFHESEFVFIFEVRKSSSNLVTL